MNPYLDPGRVRAALRALELHPTKGMGQNFLVDPQALAQIADAGELRADETVLEVGPGLGVLTWELLQRAGQVVSVELDRRLADRLAHEFAAQPHLRIVQGDILRLPPEALLDSQPYKVVANLPYAITSPVLRHFLEASWKPQLVVVLVQWEVGERIVAAAGDMSVLAHSVQLYAAAEIVGRVPPESFVPRPAVSSAILRLRLYDRPAVDVDDINAFFRVLKAGFLQPRKKLSNALPNGLAAIGLADRATALAALNAANVSPDRRAETLTLQEWAQIYTYLTRPH